MNRKDAPNRTSCHAERHEEQLKKSFRFARSREPCKSKKHEEQLRASVRFCKPLIAKHLFFAGSAKTANLQTGNYVYRGIYAVSGFRPQILQQEIPAKPRRAVPGINFQRRGN